MLVYNEMSDTYNAANVVESGKILLVHKLNSYINAYLFFFNQYRIVHRSTQPALSPDFQETVRTSVESEPYELVQKTPPTLPSPPPDPQKITSAITEANPTRISSVQTLRDIQYNACDVRFEVRNDTPCLLYKEQEEEKWVPIRVLEDESDDSGDQGI